MREHGIGASLLVRALDGLRSVGKDSMRLLGTTDAEGRCEVVVPYDGNPLRLTADSLCVHGDNPQSLAVLRRLRAALDSL